MTDRERNEWISRKQREYYKTHKSARISRLVAILGLITTVLGFRLTFSFSQTNVDIGYVLMVMGALIASITVYFFSAITNA